MASPYYLPTDGVTIYVNDRTQGPACALACPAALVYRNYLVKHGDNKEFTGQKQKQIDNLKDVGEVVGNDDYFYWTMQNGYALPINENSIKNLAHRLTNDAALVKRAEDALRVGVHWDTSVKPPETHRVCQVYASALPVSHAKRKISKKHKKELPDSEYEPFASLILRASYEATLAVAAIRSLERNERVKCYLTALGGGDFGNNYDWIRDAIKYALEQYQNYPIDVVLVFYGSDKKLAFKKWSNDLPEINIFNTNIVNPNIEKVISLSDIHGDMQSFVIALRDLAEVIKKKENIQYNQSEYDADMEKILNVDLNNIDEDKYIKDLNYEWCGGNTHVVICGDIIDPQRYDNCLKDNQLCNKLKDKAYEDCIKNRVHCSWYPQIELKILMFINALNKQAKYYGGKIIKLLGNHELGNIFMPDRYLLLGETYSFTKDRLDGTNYYKNIERVDIFKVGNPGFKLLIEGGIGLLVKINNTIFVHGDLLETYKYYDDVNKFLNNIYEQKQSIWASKQFLIRLNVGESSLWSRKRGSAEDFGGLKGSNTRASQRIKKKLGESNRFCKELVDSFKKFMEDSNLPDNVDVDDLKLVIGHCTQNNISIYNDNNVTYDTLISSDNKKQVFGKSIYTGKPVFDRTDNRTKIFGITMECEKSNNLHRVYRVDIGMSRGFDLYDNFPKTIEEENQFFYSKTPQILIVNKDGTVEIAKSKMSNTRIHLPRKDYEDFIITNKIDELQLNTKSHNFYKQKYLKYKNKYLKLKQLK